MEAMDSFDDCGNLDVCSRHVSAGSVLCHLQAVSLTVRLSDDVPLEPRIFESVPYLVGLYNWG